MRGNPVEKREYKNNSYSVCLEKLNLWKRLNKNYFNKNSLNKPSIQSMNHALVDIMPACLLARHACTVHVHAHAHVCVYALSCRMRGRLYVDGWPLTIRKLLFILLVLSVLIYLFYLIYFLLYYSFLRCLFGTLDCLFFYVNLCKFCKFNVILPLATKLNVFNKPWIIIIIIHRLYNVQPKQRRTCTFSGDRSSHHGD